MPWILKTNKQKEISRGVTLRPVSVVVSRLLYKRVMNVAKLVLQASVLKNRREINDAAGGLFFFFIDHFSFYTCMFVYKRLISKSSDKELVRANNTAIYVT